MIVNSSNKHTYFIVTKLITNRPMAGHCRKVVVLCVLPNKGGTHNEKETQAIMRKSKVS